MQQTFDNAGPTAKGSLNEVQQQDQQRQAANQSGQQNVPGEASRAQVASKDPKDYDPRGGPGSQGNKPVHDPNI
ncbi:unnamed protein product [Jaminaea pallidilutea]